jgi:hypothetical protein
VVTNATGPNDAASLLDMLVLATLNRSALEEHWIPTLLHEEGQPVLEAYRHAEDDTWHRAAKAMTSEQIAETRSLIAQWRERHPQQYYVGDIRFTDFEVVRDLKPDDSGLKLPGNVLGLLYLDPLSGLDPVAAEMKSFRDLTERMMFAAVRMPRIMGRQIDFQLHRAMVDPQVVAFVQSTARFSDATSRFADSVAKYPNQFADSTRAMVDQALKGVSTERETAINQTMSGVAIERKAAIDQANAVVASQRDELVKQLDAQQSKLRQTIGDVNGVIERANQAGVSLNTATAQTVTTTEQATRRTLDHAFRLAVMLAALLIVGIPLSLLAYRLACRKWLRPPIATESAPA